MNTVGIAGDEFGWGSVGILAAILSELAIACPSVAVKGIETASGRHVLASSGVSSWFDADEDDVAFRRHLDAEDIEVIVVALNARLANRLTRLGKSVIYVDTMPFIWGPNDFLPLDVAAYCAQRFGSAVLPAVSPVLQASNLIWVDGIVGPVPKWDGPSSEKVAVIALGGLQSPASSAESVRAYIDLAVLPAVTALMTAHVQRVRILGNVDAGLVDEMLCGDFSGRVSTERHDRQGFLSAIKGANLVACSPGLTTILEVGAMQVPAFVLPPQNYTQLRFAEEVARLTHDRSVVSWPTSVLRPQDLHVLHIAQGEDAAVRELYRRVTLASTAGRERVHGELAVAMRRCIYATYADASTLSAMNASIGDRGAAEVAGLVGKWLS